VALPPLDEPEVALLRELDARGVRFVLVGMGAAILQGATGVTQDLDLWFETLTDPRIADAVRAAGGIYVSGSFGMQPPTIGGALGDRFDVVTHADGLGPFAQEWASTRVIDIQGVRVHVLPLARVLESKRAAGRPKDLAQIPILEAALAALDDGGAPSD
jgi:hypothetical protein